MHKICYTMAKASWSHPQTLDFRLKIAALKKSFIYTCKGLKSFDRETIIIITGDIKSPDNLSKKLPRLQFRFFSAAPDRPRAKH